MYADTDRSHSDFNQLQIPHMPLPNVFDPDEHFQPTMGDMSNSSTLGQTINIQNKASDLDLSQIDDSDLSWLFPGSQMWHTS